MTSFSHTSISTVTPRKTHFHNQIQYRNAGTTPSPTRHSFFPTHSFSTVHVSPDSLHSQTYQNTFPYRYPPLKILLHISLSSSMASADLKLRKPDSAAAAGNDSTDTKKPIRDKKMAMAKRGLKSLALAISLPISLNLIAIYFSDSNHIYKDFKKPIWLPNPWILQTTSLISSFVMGVSAWLVWVEGGFHKKPTALYLYMAELLLSLAWNLVAFRYGGGSPVGLALSLSMVGALIGCAKVFKQVNPIAGDLVRFCLACGVVLATVNLKLVFV